MRRKFLFIFTLIAFPFAAFSQGERTPTTPEIQTAIRRDLDGMAYEYRREFRKQADGVVQALKASNDLKRQAIEPLYLQAFGMPIPAGLPLGVDAKNEFKNIADAAVYPDAWKKLILAAPLDSSNFMRKTLEPIISNPRSDKGAVERIQKDAGTEWDQYKTYAGDELSRQVVPIVSDFETRVADLAQEHKDLREALVAIVGPVPADDFDTNFQKYIADAQKKVNPPAPAQPAAVPAPGPTAAVTATPAPAQSGNPTPEATALLSAKVDELSASLKDQEASLHAVKTQSQNLDDNYPLLHRELSNDLRDLGSGLATFRIIVIIVGIATLGAVALSFRALQRSANTVAVEKLSRLEKELAELRKRVKSADQNESAK